MKSFLFCSSSKWWSTCHWWRVGWRRGTGHVPFNHLLCHLKPTSSYLQTPPTCSCAQSGARNKPEIYPCCKLHRDTPEIYLFTFCLQSFTDMVMLRTAFIQHELHPLLCKQTATTYITALLEFTVKWVYINLQTWLRKAAKPLITNLRGFLFCFSCILLPQTDSFHLSARQMWVALPFLLVRYGTLN